jgi:hypothetical protein
MYFKKGIHDKNNDSRINSNNVISLNSNQTVYLEEGAIVRAKFDAYQKSNIKILGPGFIDGSTFVRNATTGEVTVPIDFNYCNNVWKSLSKDGILFSRLKKWSPQIL